MTDHWPPSYDRDAYEPVLRAVAGSDRLVQFGVQRRPQAEIERRKARRARRDDERAALPRASLQG